MKIILLSDDAIRLEATYGPMTIEALSAEQSYSPFHMLASGLATCTFSVMHAWASHAELNADDLSVEVHWTFADEPYRVDSFHLTFEWPSLPERRYAAARRVAEMCTIHTTLHYPPTITVTVTNDSSTLATPEEQHAHAHSESAP